MKKIPALLASIALLSAAPALADAQNFSSKLARLSDIQQRSVMRRAILDGGQVCRQVLGTSLQGPYKNLVMWTARCAKGGDYAVYIGPDGTVQVRPCADLAKLKLPLCRLSAKPSVARAQS